MTESAWYDGMSTRQGAGSPAFSSQVMPLPVCGCGQVPGPSEDVNAHIKYVDNREVGKWL